MLKRKPETRYALCVAQRVCGEKESMCIANNIIDLVKVYFIDPLGIIEPLLNFVQLFLKSRCIAHERPTKCSDDKNHKTCIHGRCVFNGANDGFGECECDA